MDKNYLVKVSNPMAKVWIPKTKNDEMRGGEHVKKEMIEIPKEREEKREEESESSKKRDNHVGSAEKANSRNIKEVVSSGNVCVSDGSVVKAGSINRFAILAEPYDKEIEDVAGLRKELESEVVEEIHIPWKACAASTDVTEIMKSLKVKRKRPIDKGKKQGKTGYATLIG